jgi:hypothetical protein
LFGEVLTQWVVQLSLDRQPARLGKQDENARSGVGRGGVDAYHVVKVGGVVVVREAVVDADLIVRGLIKVSGNEYRQHQE